MSSYFQKNTSAAPLAVFRILLGILLMWSTIRFWSKGWIHTLYIQPKYFFPFYGFEFVIPPGQYIYLIFAICALSSLLVALGYYYRIAIVSLFLSFTYIELIDKSTYLNHYYFVSMVCLLLIFLPAHAYFSIDAYRNEKLRSDRIPQWCIDSVKLFVCFLYFYAGLAKINSDWLLEALPLKIWLPARNDTHFIGFLFNYPWVPYLFSWFGCIYDLTIPFLLWTNRTRIWAYVAVVVFHLFTSLLFPIGMFPYIMMATALIFFSSNFHDKIILFLNRWFHISNNFIRPNKTYSFRPQIKYILLLVFFIFFSIQLLLPLRYMLYPDELFWTEEGYRFSWRVMLMEKAGYTQFTVKNSSGKYIVVNNTKFLTPLQEKMVSTQPDMILQYAHILRDYYSQHGFDNPQVYVDSYVTLNGRMGTNLIDPNTDLANEEDAFKHKSWIIPFKGNSHINYRLK